MPKPARFFIIPGLGNSGPGHWQTHFEHLDPAFIRIQQRDWDTPDCSEWVTTLEQALSGEDSSTVVLIAHSLGCATIAHWALRYGHTLRGALLVAPVDVETVEFAALAPTGFNPMPVQRLPFASKVVASANDIWMSPARAEYFATAWGSELLDIGLAGHINTASGFGKWPAGRALLNEWK